MIYSLFLHFAAKKQLLTEMYEAQILNRYKFVT